MPVVVGDSNSPSSTFTDMEAKPECDVPNFIDLTNHGLSWLTA